MTWREQLAELGLTQLRDLCAYLYDSARYAQAEEEELIQAILTGKKRFSLYLMDREACKTLRRLIRHPDRPLHYRYYQVHQLLELNFIEEIPSLEASEELGWYQIREEALPYVQLLARARHYDALITKYEKLDALLLGLLHTHGLLEVHQCAELLAIWGVTISASHLFRAISWRLSIREELIAFTVKVKQQTLSFIMLRGLDFPTCYQALVQKDLMLDTLIEEAEMCKRADRYFAMELIEIQELMKKIRTRFSRKFAEDTARELIEAAQYHCGECKHEKMLYRVFEEDELVPYLTLAREALPDILKLK